MSIIRDKQNLLGRCCNKNATAKKLRHLGRENSVLKPIEIILNINNTIEDLLYTLGFQNEIKLFNLHIKLM